MVNEVIEPGSAGHAAGIEAEPDVLSSSNFRVSPLRLLVAEDIRDVARSFTSMLSLWGHEVHVAYDGPQALSMADQALAANCLARSRFADFRWLRGHVSPPRVVQIDTAPIGCRYGVWR